MNRISPIYTHKTKCRDCFKCIRHCPVKAIKVENGSAVVDSERCILCGKCTQICPVEAKRVRNDVTGVELLLETKTKVIVSLAPSYKSMFDCSDSALIAALKKLGFSHVSETALGATIVSQQVAEELKKEDANLLISSACPVVNEYISKYKPEFSTYLSKLLSPAQAHAKYLKEHYGNDVAVVFINPCVAKKNEADLLPVYIDISITFTELNEMFINHKVHLEETDEQHHFEPVTAGISSSYPLDGGMIDTVKEFYTNSDADFISFTDLREMEEVLKTPTDYNHNKLFLELMACPGGCINGPSLPSSKPLSLRKLSVQHGVNNSISEIEKLGEIAINNNYPVNRVEDSTYSDSELNAILRQIGKCSHKDELNCGGCGYSTCRDFATAVLNGFAQKYMCVTYMRSLAMNKANALLKAMPSGVIIVDDKLKVIECNRRFAEIIGGDLTYVFDAKPGLTDSYLKRIVSFSSYFEAFLKSPNELLETEFSFNKKILKLILFPIEGRRIIGGIVQDITHPSMHREQVIEKAKKVIMTNLTAVQQIAFLLGESASETEILLNSIIDSFEHDKND